MISIIIPVYNNENTISGTLKSIVNQSYSDFEVIVVNDGSTDRSGKILKEFAESDERFTYVEQENLGVSAARNHGLKYATRKYVTFVDADDTLPQRSLQYMHQIAVTNDADTIVGVYERVDGTETRTLKRVKNLVNGSLRIYPDNLDMIHAWTLCNKWLSRDIIEKYHVRFESIGHLEDAVFLYTYLKNAEKIYTCPHTVYKYFKPVPMLGRTSTQGASVHMLNSALEAYGRLQELTDSYGWEFHSELAYRYLNAPLLSDYYRRIWMMEDDAADILMNTIESICSSISDDHISKCERKDFDVFKNGRYASKEELVSHPLISIAITSQVSTEAINDILTGIYDQSEVAFNVIVDDSFISYVNADFRQKQNLIWSNGRHYIDIVKRTGTEYMIALDANAIFNHATLLTAIKHLRNHTDIEVVSVTCDNLVDGHVNTSKLFEHINTGAADSLDCLLANKIIRCTDDILDDLRAGADGADLLERNKYSRLNNNKILVLGTDTIILQRAEIRYTEEVKEYLDKITETTEKKKDRVSIATRIRRKLGRQYHKWLSIHKKNNAPSEAREKTSQKKDNTLHYYLDLDIKKGRVVVEGLGKRPKGSSLYILRELLSGDYGDLEIIFPVRDDSVSSTKEIFAREGFDTVKIVHSSTDEYKEALFSAEFLFNEVEFPIWWVKKPGQTYVNLWHGTPLKTLGKAKAGPIYGGATPAHNFTSADYMLMPNEYCIKHIIEDMDLLDITPTQAIMLGYPRTGNLISNNEGTNISGTNYLNNVKIAAWMPTWNDSIQTDLVIEFLEEIENTLPDGWVFFVNLHHKTNDGIDYSLFSKVRKFPAELDTYEFLTMVDVLITDYSSVFFDFAATRRKIILHCPDKDQYKASRGIYMDPEEMPFPVTTSSQELVGEISKPKAYDDNAFVEQFNKYDSYLNTTKLCRAIIYGDFSGIEVREFNKRDDITFAVLDSFREGVVNDWIQEIYHDKAWQDNLYLSFNVKAADEASQEFNELFRGVHIFPTKGKSFSIRTERKRLYGDIIISKFILIDPANHKRIRSFASFTEPVKLLLTERQINLLKQDDEDTLKAVKFFGKYGNEIGVLSENDRDWMQSNLGITSQCINSKEVFYDFLIN